MKKKIILMIIIIIVVIVGIVSISLSFNLLDKEESKPSIPKKTTESTTTKYVPERKELLVSAVGDCTLGTDDNFGYAKSFNNVVDNKKKDFSYFFSGVYSVLSKDDLSIANLEGTFTDAKVKNPKKFNFKGDADYANILPLGSIEAVNLANNHTFDYLEKGYTDTLDALKKVKVPYFGYEEYTIVEKNGIKFGLAGITGWSESEAIKNTTKAVAYLKEQKADVIIISYHWGIENTYNPTGIQKRIAHHAIDCGADLILGHHPHVVQGVEKYKDKYIVYSLGNFVFGGNKNPKDKDTMIFQEKFTFEDGKIIDTSINIIPASLSGLKNWNDFRPVVAEGTEKERILNKILKTSTNISYPKEAN